MANEITELLPQEATRIARAAAITEEQIAVAKRLCATHFIGTGGIASAESITSIVQSLATNFAALAFDSK